jgi:hypothetical protein
MCRRIIGFICFLSWLLYFPLYFPVGLNIEEVITQVRKKRYLRKKTENWLMKKQMKYGGSLFYISYFFFAPLQWIQYCSGFIHLMISERLYAVMMSCLAQVTKNLNSTRKRKMGSNDRGDYSSFQRQSSTSYNIMEFVTHTAPKK